MQKKYIYSLRFALIPNTDLSQRTDALVRFCQQADIDDVMFFIGAEDFGNGHLTKEMAAPYFEIIRATANRLKQIGITVSLNPWITLGHADRGRLLHPGQEDFELMVDANGRKASTVTCPLGNAWRRYFCDYLRFLCDAIQPHVLWLEDDFRMLNHEPLEFGGCFCAEHMRRYAEKLGRNTISREEFVEGLHCGNAAFIKAYSEVSGEGLADTLKVIVDALDGHQDRFGLMTGLAAAHRLEGRNEEEIFKILSRRAPAVNRATMISYRQNTPQNYCYEFNKLVLPNRYYFPADVEVYSEIENFPMTRYCKSVNYTGFQMEMTIPFLFAGSTFDIFEFNGNGVTDGKLFAEKLKKLKPYLACVNDLGLTYSDARGVKVLLDKTGHHHIKATRFEDFLRDGAYFGNVFAAMGITMRYAESFCAGDVVALSSVKINAASDDEIRRIFKECKVILNADGVEALLDRGLGALINADAIERMAACTGKYTYEEACAICGCAGERASTQYFCGDYGKITYLTDVAAYTKLYNYDYTEVGNGITVVGGNCLIIPYYQYLDGTPHGFYHPMRAQAISVALTKVFNYTACVSVNGCLLAPYLFEKDGKDYLMLCNYIDDVAENVVLKTLKRYTRISVISADDVAWKDINFTACDGTYALALDIKPSSSVILKLS